MKRTKSEKARTRARHSARREICRKRDRCEVSRAELQAFKSIPKPRRFLKLRRAINKLKHMVKRMKPKEQLRSQNVDHRLDGVELRRELPLIKRA